MKAESNIHFSFAEKGEVTICSSEKPFHLCSGHSLKHAKIQYKIFRTNLSPVKKWHLLFHGLTGSHRVEEWWPFALNSEKSFAEPGEGIICFNSFGSCFGSKGPTAINPETSEPFGLNFPFFDIYDSVKAVCIGYR